ncbi:trans-aconitate 2-methyltransferase [Pseudonocardia sp. KRD291]|uniref:class I SAM-dependent methyltransferase n=1 Tax=Pseudonocardia sp. KRD291 TaxID=2792007 RepID=UPI001C4A5D4F|nr:class I SAM-dependent methyltransferase [Pseudonocardia sp. KRD291]MBW0101635.1 class I SAM-dependent methyltransferase [Pseudonocardia sp. KRD291]
MDADSGSGEQQLLAEQVNYYRAVADEYLDGKLDEPGGDELAVAVAKFAPAGDVLELASGPGTWTPQLLRRADTVTAVDSSREMQALAKQRVAPDLARARFVQADLFAWEPDRRYDGVFMGFWISHVPWGRFAEFWALVDRSLRPGGQVLFVDDAHRTEQELIHGEASTTIQRRLRDGTPHRAVKVPHTPDGLEQELTSLGWNVRVHQTAGPFYWGIGTRRP